MKLTKILIGFTLIFTLSSATIFFIIYFFNKMGLDSNYYSQIESISTALASIGGLTLLVLSFLTYYEARKQRIAQEEPVVTIRLITDNKNSNILNLHLKNTGGGPAYDLKVKFDPDVVYGDITLNQLKMFTGMYLLEKGEEITFFFDTAIDYFNSNKPTTINAQIVYYTLPKDNKGAKKLSRDIEINIDERKNQRQIIKKDLNDLIHEIEELKHFIIISKFEQDEKNDKRNF